MLETLRDAFAEVVRKEVRKETIDLHVAFAATAATVALAFVVLARRVHLLEDVVFYGDDEDQAEQA